MTEITYQDSFGTQIWSATRVYPGRYNVRDLAADGPSYRVHVSGPVNATIVDFPAPLSTRDAARVRVAAKHAYRRDTRDSP